MDYVRLTALRDEYAELTREGQQILKTADADNNRDISAEENGRFTEIHERQVALDARIELELNQGKAEERMRELNSTAGIKTAGSDNPKPESTEDRQKAEGQAFNAYLRYGVAGCTLEQRERLQARFNAIQNPGVALGGGTPEERALSVGVSTAGGYTVPEGFWPEMESALLSHGGMRRAGTKKIRTATGQDLPIPTDDDTSNSGAILSENTQVSTQDVTFGIVTLGSYMYTSKLVLVSIQLLQDSFFDLNGFLGEKLGTRIARATNAHFSTGTGTGQPSGIITGATSGKTAASATAVTFDELIDLKHSVDPDYRAQNPQWMFNDTTLRDIKKLKNGSGDYLWQPRYLRLTGAPPFLTTSTL